MAFSDEHGPILAPQPPTHPLLILTLVIAPMFNCIPTPGPPLPFPSGTWDRGALLQYRFANTRRASARAYLNLHCGCFSD